MSARERRKERNVRGAIRSYSSVSTFFAKGEIGGIYS
jgi:hypothetical protein